MSESCSGVFLLFLAFMVLKLTNVISWSWWLVCLPLYAGFVVIIGVAILSLLGLSLHSLFSKNK